MALDSEVVPPEQLREIERLAGNRTLEVTVDRSVISSHLQEIEVAAGRYPHDLIAKSDNLQWFQQWSAGADWLGAHPEALEHQFQLTKIPGVQPIPIGEHVLALMLALARRLPQVARAQAERKWLQLEELPVSELYGSKVVVMGAGDVGSRIVELTSVLGLHTTVVRRNPSTAVPFADEVVGPGDLLSVLAKADYLVLSLPLTEETRQIVGEEELNALPDHANIINVGRGRTIDEEALISALGSGSIAGAALDVFEAGQLPADSPLWAMDNVVVTPHMAGHTPHYDYRSLEIFIQNLKRYLNGEKLQFVVDKKRGY